MKKEFKKYVAVTMVCGLVATSLIGCSNKEEKAVGHNDNHEAIMLVAGSERVMD